MNILIIVALVLVLNSFQINAEEGVKDGYGGGYGDYGGYEEKKIIKPGVVKPHVIPYFKPIISYSKYPNYGGYGFGEGKLIPIDKIHDYQPQFDLTKFIKPYEHAHLLQKYGKPDGIVKYAPPVYIRQPPITKTIYQHVYVKQPHIVEKIPVIHKSTEVVIKKKPPKVEFDKEVPIDVKDFGKTAVVKPHIPVEEGKVPLYQKPKVEEGYGEGGFAGGEGGAQLKAQDQ